MELSIISVDGQNGRDGLVGGICLDSNLLIRDPVVKYRSLRKCTFEGLESFLASVRPDPRDVGTSKASKRNGDFRVAVDETSIKVTKAKEGLDVLDFSWNRPLRDSGDFDRRHAEAVRRKNVAKIFAGCDAEFAFRQFAV